MALGRPKARATIATRRTAGARVRRVPTWLFVSSADRDLVFQDRAVVAGTGAGAGSVSSGWLGAV
jgi:hypothetical protein